MSHFLYEGKRRVPAFAPASLALRSAVRCLTPVKIQGNKITGVSFLKTYPWLSYGRLCASLLSPPALHKGQLLLKKLEDEEQAAVSPMCNQSHQGHHCTSPSRQTPNPITTSSHVSSLCTSQNTQTKAKRDAVEPHRGCSGALPFWDICQAGCTLHPITQPQGTPWLPLSQEKGALCTATAQHPQCSGTLCWP